MKTCAFIIISLLTIFIMIALLTISGCNDYDKADRAAAEYAKNLPGSTGKISCVHSDSDNDGYASCSVFMKNRNPVSIECLVSRIRGSGCKIAIVKIKRHYGPN